MEVESTIMPLASKVKISCMSHDSLVGEAILAVDRSRLLLPAPGFLSYT